MFKKNPFYWILISFLFFGKASASEGGMPQLNPEYWISQIFWLTLVFGFLYLLLSKLILPKISNNLESRKSQIVENIEAAEKQRLDSDKKLKDYEKIITDAKNEAKNIGVDFLGSIPLDIEIRIGSDNGKPIFENLPDSPQSKAYLEISRNIYNKVSEVDHSSPKIIIE